MTDKKNTCNAQNSVLVFTLLIMNVNARDRRLASLLLFLFLCLLLLYPPPLFVIHPPAVHKNFLAIQKYSNIIPAVNKKKNRAIKRFYTLVLSVLRVRQRKRVYACLCHECGMASSSGPASNWGPSQFCETPGGREERDKDREPCHQNLSSSGSLLINLQSWGSLAETH